MSKSERKEHIKRFNETDPVPTSNESPLNKSSDSPITKLSVSETAAVELTSLSHDIIEGHTKTRITDQRITEHGSRF